MSWDVSIMKFSKPYASVEDIPDDETLGADRNTPGPIVATKPLIFSRFSC